MAYTFKGGVHVEEYKNTRRAQVELITPPKMVSIPLSQHIGSPCSPLVKKGDHVDMGQPIGDVPTGSLGCPVHASISGVVAGIEDKYTPSGQKTKNVVIENDFNDTVHESVVPFKKKLIDTDSDEIISIIRAAGISGMGGAMFPTYAKIQSAIGKAYRIIVNCAECEPYITANHRLLLENPASVINGVKILLKATGIRTAIIAVEDNKLDAVNKLEELLDGSKMISVKIMKTKYPQGDERQLIYALSGHELPAGKLPADLGCVIFNAETCSSVFKAFAKGMPLIKRIVTVDGDCIKSPKNLLVPIGTSYSDVIRHCGGLIKSPKTIISGGPMMGFAQWDINSPVTKGTSAVLVFSKTPESKQPPACIHCGRCVRGCPMHLMPNYIAQFAQTGDMERAEQYGAASCVECGSCSYSCPGFIPIVQYVRVAKEGIKLKNSTK